MKEACGWSGGCNQGIFFMEGNDFTKVFGTIFVARAPKKQGWGDRKPGLEGEDWVKNKEVWLQAACARAGSTDTQPAACMSRLMQPHKEALQHAVSCCLALCFLLHAVWR